MYAKLNNEGVVLQQVGMPIPDGVGPPLEPPPAEAGVSFVLLVEPIDWAGRPSETCVMLWREGEVPKWTETAPLPVCQARALQQIDAAGESLRLAVVNHMTMQTEEYRQALLQAQAWRAAGYPETDEEPAPPDVVSWAVAKWRQGWTARRACDDILATAALWETVLSKVRMLRLANKEDVRHALDFETIATIVADMKSDMGKIAAQLGLAVQ